MPESRQLAAAKDAVQEAENLIRRHVSDYTNLGLNPTGAPLTVRDGMIIVDALIKVMEAIEASHA